MSNKLFIRSEVMAVVALLSADALEDAFAATKVSGKSERARQTKRLAKIEPRAAVLEILIRELPRSAGHRPTLQTVAELLMNLGDIEQLQKPLWDLIKSEDATDDIKDAANMILRHLGDATDPDLYLSYLNDPMGLISRETERMLAMSASNPEALIDFLDFLFSLPAIEQQNLIYSLHADYPTDELLNLYIAGLLAEPEPELVQVMLKNVGQIRSPRAARFMQAMHQYYQQHPRYQDADTQAELNRVFRLAEKSYKLQGLQPAQTEFEPKLLSAFDETNLALKHFLQETPVETCCMTLPDIMGNQGVLVARKHANGDYVLICVALNDIEGIVDTFGFLQLAPDDYERIVAKFHEESSKIEVPVAACLAQLQRAEQKTLERYKPLPYEYACWKAALSDIAPESALLTDDLQDNARALSQSQWQTMTEALSQHPDFNNWFIDELDDHEMNEPDALAAAATQPHWSLGVAACVQMAEGQNWALPQLAEALEQAAESLMAQWLSQPALRDALAMRLARAARMLQYQHSDTFAGLAATEATRLWAGGGPEATTFARWIGLRSIEECLLKYRLHPQTALAEARHIERLLESGWPPKRAMSLQSL
ncbi:MAG: hypothetical protein VKJ06_03595 [Vampirovibrionales bacterium]|nr:hypothetical protein [Vampirovibrionales bacterium]